jgi:predicted amidohydrolase
MDNLLKIAAFQTDIAWENKENNITHAEQLINGLNYTPNLIIFPEMFLTGFSMNTAKIAESMTGRMVKWMKKTADQTGSSIMGSLPIASDGKYFNRLLVVSPDNKVVWYDKRHLFRMGEELHFYTGGTDQMIFSQNDWKIKPLVCYDLRFPIWSRNINLGYDLLIYVANWPAARDDAFVSLLKARAIENQAYVVGVNRVGTDGNGIAHKGNSIIYDALGKSMNQPVENSECVINIELSMEKLKQFRQKFPAHLDADDFTVKV